MKRLLIILAMVATLLLAACGASPAAKPSIDDASAGAGIMVIEPFARASVPNGAVYMTLMNQSDSPDALIGVASDVAEATELHETTMDENDVMRMRPIEKVELPAGGSAVLEPGGKHIMLIGLNPNLAQGDTFSLTLTFAQAGPQTIDVTVQDGPAMEHNPDEMEMESEHSMDTN